MKTIVIGSGMSGLTAGAFLAQAGHAVTVYEQFAEPGGVTATVKQDGFGWDIGPLILEGFGPGDRGWAVLDELGVADRVKTVHEDRGLSTPDFSLWKPDEYGGMYWRQKRLAQLYPTERKNLERYYQFYEQVIALMSMVRQAEGASGLQAGWLKLRMALAFNRVKDKVDWNAGQLMDHYFQEEAIKLVFTGIVADFVTKPSEFPALGVPSIHLETAFDKRIPVLPGTQSAHTGYFYVLGGCQSLVNAVQGALVEAGGQVRTAERVEKILIESGKATGVVMADGRFEPADLVIASGGAKETFLDLVGREYLPSELIEQIERCTYMESVLMVQLGIDFDPRPYQRAALCYYYLTYDLEGAVERVRQGIYHEGKEGFLIYVPSLHSPELAPPGQYAMTIYTIAPNILAQGSWAERREELADKLVAEAEKYVPGLGKHTVTRMVLTPEDFRIRVNQKHHSFGGIPPVIGNKNPPHRTPIQGLWFIGSQSESGGGVQNVTLGGRKAARMILSELGGVG
jgi:phytoene dehydrogenase-like protein